MSYGTGPMAVLDMTKETMNLQKFNLPIIEVVAGGDLEKEAFTDIEKGIMVNSGIINGLKLKMQRR